eukprot:Pgem_evm1s6210
MSSITFNHAYPDHNNDITFKNKEVKVKICFQPPSCLKKTNIAKKSNTHFNPQRYGISSADRDNVSLWIQVLVKSLNRACDIYFMCIDILDRFLSKIKVSSSRQLKLIATACLFLSIKYLEDMDKVPKLSNIINHTGNIFSANDVKRMERIILEKLKYELCNMNCIDYLLKYVNALRPLFSAAATAALREGKQFVSPPDMNEIVRFSVNHLVISSRYEFLEYGPQQLVINYQKNNNI